MATVNKRIGSAQASTINGVTAGGMMSASIDEGYDQEFASGPDGLQCPILDRVTQYCRGSIISQDWIEMINLLIGTVGTYVFYERKSGVAEAEATGYVKHTLLNPVIHGAALSLSSGDKATALATCSCDFECKAADPTNTIANLHVPLDSQAAPTYLPSARGGIRILTTLHGAVSIYHVTNLSAKITIPIRKASNDGDVAYTAVDADLNGMSVSGSISFQDAAITAAQLKCQDLLLAARSSLVVTIRQAGGAVNKVLTLAGVIFGSAKVSPSANAGFSEFTVPFKVSNDATTQLTLAGANKIITIADAV